MKTTVVKLDPAEPDMESIKKAAELIDDGGLAAFPTETVYGIACRVKTDSLIRLNDLKGRDAEKYYTLHIGEKNDVKKYVPSIGVRAEKLIENAWPGPVTIVFELNDRDIDKQRNSLEKDVFENLYKDSSIGIRCPANLTASALLHSAKKPVVAPSANITGRPPAVNAEQAFAYFSGKIELLLDAGPSKYKKSSTVVKIGKEGLQILRPGVYSQTELQSLSQVKFLFVCTGNTCRSPMAEGLFRKYLAEKLKCKVDRLEEKGYKLFSAGTMGMVGSPASPQAVAACAAKGIDINNHSSTALSKQLVDECDFIFAMSRMHQEQIAALCSQAADKCVLLAENQNIPDPIGQPQQVYDNCAEMIEKAVKKRISELVI